jgi:DNA-binding transcriptional LysR family regulator
VLSTKVFISQYRLRMIRERRLDVGFVVLPIADPGLKFRLLVREPLVAVLPENHLMASIAQSFIEGAG